MPKRVEGWLGELMKQTGKSRRELLVLADRNDPFYAGTRPAQRKAAEWFARMWELEYKGQTGIHIRRCYYHLGAIKFPKMDGTPYTYTNKDWRMLEEGCKVARILDLAPPEAFEDHRNAEPYRLDWQTAEVREPTISRPTANWFLPCVSSSRWILETPRVSGYTPDDYLDRAYMLEIWIEKSTMDDVLVPLTRELGVRLVTSVGFQSHSNVIKLLQRVREIGKPTRIFYISDYDKAGRGMPIAVARHIEFYRPKYAPDSDIKLSILALTPEQIDQFDLPRSVEKAGATELDALEALRPGELERIVRSAIEPYLAKSINAQLDAAQRQAQTIVRQKWSRLMTPHQQTLEILRTRVETIRKKHEKRLQRELAPFEKPLARLKADVERAALSFRPKLPARPTQAANDPTSQDCLFDSSRPYLVQLRFYKSQRKSAE